MTGSYGGRVVIVDEEAAKDEQMRKTVYLEYVWRAIKKVLEKQFDVSPWGYNEWRIRVTMSYGKSEDEKVTSVIMVLAEEAHDEMRQWTF